MKQAIISHLLFASLALVALADDSSRGARGGLNGGKSPKSRKVAAEPLKKNMSSMQGSWVAYFEDLAEKFVAGGKSPKILEQQNEKAPMDKKMGEHLKESDYLESLRAERQRLRQKNPKGLRVKPENQREEVAVHRSMFTSMADIIKELQPIGRRMTGQFKNQVQQQSNKIINAQAGGNKKKPTKKGLRKLVTKAGGKEDTLTEKNIYRSMAEKKKEDDI